MKRCVFTFLFIGICWWAFFVELLGSHDFEPHVSVLIALGGLVSSALENEDQWYRFLTHLFLHGSLLHLIFNSIALYFGGRFLETLVGSGLFILTFFISGIAGGWCGLMTSGPQTVLIGASGAVMGVLSALLIYVRSLPASPARRTITLNGLQMIIPSMIPVISGVSYGAHIGGLLAGLLCGGIICAIKRKPV